MKSTYISVLFLLFVSVGYSQGFLDSIALLKESTIKASTSAYGGDYYIEGRNLYKSPASETPAGSGIIIDSLEIAYEVHWKSKKVGNYEVWEPIAGEQVLVEPSNFIFFQGKLSSAKLFFDTKLSYEIEKKVSKICGDLSNQDTLRWSNDKYDITYYRYAPQRSTLLEIDFTNKVVDKKLTAYSTLHEHDDEKPVEIRKGKGNSSFIPDLNNSLKLLDNPTIRKNFEVTLPAFSVIDKYETHTSYNEKTQDWDLIDVYIYKYQFNYKGCDIDLELGVKANQIIKSIEFYYNSYPSFFVFDIDKQATKLGFTYDRKRNYIKAQLGSPNGDMYRSANNHLLVLYSFDHFKLSK